MIAFVHPDSHAVLAAQSLDLGAGIAFYAALGVLAIIVSGAILHHNMGYLLDAAFGGAHKLAASANRLLLVGYGFLIGGFLVLSIPTGGAGSDYASVLDFLRWKIGVLAIALGVGYFGGLVACSFVCGSALQRVGVATRGVD